MTWLPISLKNAAKCDKWYQLQNHHIAQSLNANGAWEKLFRVIPVHATFSVSTNKKTTAALFFSLSLMMSRVCGVCAVCSRDVFENGVRRVRVPSSPINISCRQEGESPVCVLWCCYVRVRRVVCGMCVEVWSLWHEGRVCLLWGGVLLHFVPLETRPLSRLPSFPLRVIIAASFHPCRSRTPPLPPPVFTSKLFELKRQSGDVAWEGGFLPSSAVLTPHCGTGVCMSAHPQEFIYVYMLTDLSVAGPPAKLKHITQRRKRKQP
ncbi:unnamed protein product [Trypanosoma congolense IL3000]|uniref:WGS project CAEQ00000000 data, annotated contig 2273 n=1 Tax=Trypanosoma congolense (strain IL3000) TaxID=1068625 RepID=F9WCU8_TRYCI|nr:unnamed protein product [Trypanosoma congolense IL3000]